MKKLLAALAAALLVMAVGSARAQESQDTQGPDTAEAQQASESQPGVARVSFIRGDVSVQRGDSGDWVALTVNTPVSVGDRLSTGPKSSAEIQLDFANVLRMSDGSTVKIASLSRSQIQVQVGQGLVSYSVLKGTEALAEIDTPNVVVKPLLGEGEFRVHVGSDSETEVVVRLGSAEVATPQGSTRVDKGQLITIQGTDAPQYKVTDAPARDDWDRFVADRDHRITTAQSWHNTNRYYTGSEDLDQNGVWSEVPDYGRVWTPTQGPGWSPYSTGRWVYEPYYGWTWVSYEPWGWAPYHYGRWFVYGGNWAWWPGPVYADPGYYPIWAPAYVSFFGFGRGGFGVGFGFGFGFGRVGWLPIGPCDRFFPWWGRYGGRANVFNVANIRSINGQRGGFGPLAGNIHGRQFSNFNEVGSNARVRGGITTMDGNRFGREGVRGNSHVVSQSEFRQASMMTGKVPANPSRESYRSTDRAASASTIRSGSANSQRFFSASNSRSNSAVAGRNARAETNRVPQSSTGGRTQPSTGFNRPGSSVNGRSSSNVPTNRAGSTAPSASARPGYRPFTHPSSGSVNRTQPAYRSNGRAPSSANSGRGSYAPPAARSGSAAANPGGFRGYGPPNNSQRSYGGPSAPSRGGYAGGYNRPQLNMRQPIVRPRAGSSSGYNAPRGGSPGGGSRGGAPSAPSRGSSGGSHGGGSSHSGSSHSGGRSR
ncbi:MAG: DUF6600 domain-containing protein [Candidatus Acidiferrales bacterium]